MRKILFVSILSISMLTHISYAANKSNNYKVTFYNIVSQNKGLPLEACKEMLKTFTFSVAGNNYNFNQNDNPSYSNHQAQAFLTLSESSFLELDTIQSKFHYNNKDYQFSSNLSSITQTTPFIIRGVIINQYCKAAYVVLLDDAKNLSSTPVISISPTSVGDKKSTS